MNWDGLVSEKRGPDHARWSQEFLVLYPTTFTTRPNTKAITPNLNKKGKEAEPRVVKTISFLKQYKNTKSAVSWAARGRPQAMGKSVHHRRSRITRRLSSWQIFTLPCYYRVKKSGWEITRHWLEVFPPFPTGQEMLTWRENEWESWLSLSLSLKKFGTKLS